MPLLFIGHGSPMNAIDSNDYTRILETLGTTLPRPKAILVISAHWMTEGSWVTEMARPKRFMIFTVFLKNFLMSNIPLQEALKQRSSSKK